MTFVQRLVWNTWNVAHIARHEVAPEEVEEVCHGEPLALRGYRNRIILIGPTDVGRMLAVVLGPEAEGVYYPVTARPASRKERRFYLQDRGGETK